MEPTQQATILVVDDEARDRTLLEATLTADGHAVRVAASGEEALAATAAQLPDLILLDIMMPGLDGFEVARRLKADSRTRAIPIILATVLEDSESRLRGLEAGAEEFLNKPLDRAELLVRVRNLLRIKAFNDFLANHNLILEQQVAARTAALKESESKYRELFDSSRDALMVIKPPSWHFTDANQATLQLFGAASQAEFTALGPWDVSPERQPDGRPSAEKAQEMIATALREGSRFFEWEHRRLNGETFAADVLLTRVEAEGEVSVQATVRDITERKLAESQLAEQLDELRRWQEATLGREMRTLELKREVNELLGQAGQPPRYLSVEPGNAE